MIVLYFFDRSLENVQYYHNRLLDYEWKPEQIPLKYCCLASSIRNNPNYYLLGKYVPEISSVIKIIQGYNNKYNLETYGIAFRVNSILYVVFISTCNLDDVYTSLCSSPRSIYIGNVHKGYHDHFQNGIYSSVLWAIHELRGYKELKLIGHSMGGVMASLMGLFLRYELKMDSEVITYGCPRWGDKKLRNNMDSSFITNYINITDPIPKRPTRYVPIGNCVYYNIDTSNDNVNHGIRVYREIVTRNDNHKIKKRSHRFDETVSSMILSLFQ